ncbi:MAG: dephospho-CoA kinase [Phycisphaeraceae bacterium]|nr:MAG: dephospho-CoA kinase [Phycisphaeraceae bacterium]
MSRARVPVIGLAGGIGSGKSTVARFLADLGCVVSDSDSEAKACLQQVPVKGLLVERWGGGVVEADGTVSRSAVAKIVFADEEERVWLESVIHPRLKSTRVALYERAVQEGAAGFVIDAPLLFEAGLHAECDAVIFVDCPRAERLRRVSGSRGWDEAELERREKAQLDLDEKRRRSDYLVRNAGDPDALRAGVREAFDQIRRVSGSR